MLAKAEEKFFHQRSRVQWYGLGDRNTALYHKMVDQRTSWNHIHFLKKPDGSLVSGIDNIKAHAAEYFSQILGITDMPTSPCSISDLENLHPFRCSTEHTAELVKPIQEEEIIRIVFALPLDKSSGPDGYNVEFLRASWSVIGSDVMKAVKEFFVNGRLLRDLNSTAIVMIPKTLEACALGDYRPISCCNIVYKIISKIIANRLKSILRVCISRNQAAFFERAKLREECAVGFRSHHGL